MKVLSKSHLHRYGRSHVAIAEKAALSRCLHPNVIRLYHTFQDNQSLYFILELAEGGDVAALIADVGGGEGGGEGEGLPLPLVRFFSAQLLWCLHYLHHSVHLLHRDVKPSNFLLSLTRQLKLADFGTAKIIDSPPLTTSPSTAPPTASAPTPAASSTSTSPPPKKRSFVGTAAYVAPEILNDGDVGYGVDLWSAGCSIYQMLTGTTPFDAPSEYLTFQRILHGEMTLPQRGLDPHAIHLIRRLMERDPGARLGCREEDWQEVESHPFFEGIQWEKMKEGTAESPPLPSEPKSGKKWSLVSEDSLVEWTRNTNRGGGGGEEERHKPPQNEEDTEGEVGNDEGGGEELLRGETMRDIHLLSLPSVAVTATMEVGGPNSEGDREMDSSGAGAKNGEDPAFPLRHSTAHSQSSLALQLPPRPPPSSSSTFTSSSSSSTSLSSSSASSGPSISPSQSSPTIATVPLSFPSSVLHPHEGVVLSSRVRPTIPPSSLFSSLCLPCIFSPTVSSPSLSSSLLLLTSKGRILCVEEGKGAGGANSRHSGDRRSPPTEGGETLGPVTGLKEWKVSGSEEEGGWRSQCGGGHGKGDFLRFVPSLTNGEIHPIVLPALPTSPVPHISPPVLGSDCPPPRREALNWEILSGSSSTEWLQAVPWMMERSRSVSPPPRGREGESEGV